MKYIQHIRYSLLLCLILGAGSFSGLLRAQTVICPGEMICLTISARGDITWQDSPDGMSWSNIAGSNDTVCVFPTTDTWYRAAVVEGTCDTIFSDTTLITVSEVMADAGPDTTIGCQDTFWLSGSASGGLGPYTYNWQPAGNLTNPNIANPGFLNPGTGTFQYLLTVTDAAGCTDMDTLTINAGGGGSGLDSTTFVFTGGVQYFVIPPCTDSITAKVWGAQGGANWVSNDNFGGYAQGKFAVSPGDTLWVYVGGQANGWQGGWNGGGNGESGTNGQGGGGGSDVRYGGTTLNDRIVVGGGGGGAGYWSSTHVVGGQGGGLTGGDGYRTSPSTPGGKGGTQSAGGADGTCISFNVTACAGSFGQGGSITGCGCEVYGGGGGWYGGAASGNCRGGGGGSGYVSPSATNAQNLQGLRAGNGLIVIYY